jgi:hypothetical protein
METAAISATFIFAANGFYQSMHRGASGRVSILKFFSEK